MKRVAWGPLATRLPSLATRLPEAWRARNGGPPRAPRPPRRRDAGIVAVVALTLLVAAAAGLRAWAGSRVHGPWIEVDETIYAKLGLSLWEHGRLDVLGGPTPFYSLLYPAFAGVPLVLGGMRSGAEALRVLQAVLVALTALPVYLWARSLAPRRWALAAAVLALAPAGLAYSGMLMTESLFTPLLACACWALARALERPGSGRAALAVALVVASCATRVQAIVLVPAALTAAVLLAVAERRPDALRRFLLPAWVLSLAVVAWAGWRVAAGKPLLGSYEAAAKTSYSTGGVVRFAGYHLADLLLVGGVLPLLAVLLLGVRVLRGREPSPAVRAYTATALAVTAWTVVQVGAFASANLDGFVAERNVFTLVPVLSVGMAAWLGSGAPRPRLATPLVAAGLLGLCATLPLQQLLTPAAMPYAPSSVAPMELLGNSSAGVQRAALLGATAAALVLAWLLPRRLLWTLGAVAVAVLVAASVEASRYVAHQAAVQQQRFLGPDPEWVDRHASGPVAYVYDGDRDWDGVWANLFWNRRIAQVVDLPGTEVVGAVPQRHVEIPASGIFTPVEGAPPTARWAVAAMGLDLRGAPAADAPQQLPGQAGLRLWRLDGPLALGTVRSGFAPNGDVYGGATASLAAYGCVRGDFLATLISKQEQTVDVLRDGALWRRLRLAAGEIWRGRVDVTPARSRAARAGRQICTLAVRPSGLLGTTVFLFERR